METKTEGARALGFILSEANGMYSREAATIASGEGKLEAGSVLGKVTATGKYVFSPHAQVAGKEGAESAAAVLAYPADATSADAACVIVKRAAEVKGPELLYHATVDDAAKKATKAAQLAAATIIVR